jgi:hypothetical protein
VGTGGKPEISIFAVRGPKAKKDMSPPVLAWRPAVVRPVGSRNIFSLSRFTACPIIEKKLKKSAFPLLTDSPVCLQQASSHHFFVLCGPFLTCRPLSAEEYPSSNGKCRLSSA